MIVNIFSRLLLSGLLALPGPGNAETAYRWTDVTGHTHFSDTPPPAGTGSLSTLSLPTSRAGHPPRGLRDGERRALSDLDTRRQQQQQAAARRSAQARRELERHRAECRQAKDELHEARSREARREHSAFLRSHCW